MLESFRFARVLEKRLHSLISLGTKALFEKSTKMTMHVRLGRQDWTRMAEREELRRARTASFGRRRSTAASELKLDKSAASGIEVTGYKLTMCATW